MQYSEAVQKLKKLNQYYVNKNGVTGYSNETDDIIKTLVEYYNKSEHVKNSLQRSNQRLQDILQLYGIPINEFNWFPDWFLHNQIRILNNNDQIPDFNYWYLHYSLLNAECTWQTNLINGVINDVIFYHSLNPDLQQWLLTVSPEIKPFINIPLENLTTEITEYYVRAFTN